MTEATLLNRLKRFGYGRHHGPMAQACAEAADEIERLQGLLADKDYIRTLADYQRGHLSYAGQLEARERQPINRKTQARIMAVTGHLGAALMQSIPSDDKIIMEHVRAAYEDFKKVAAKLKQLEDENFRLKNYGNNAQL